MIQKKTLQDVRDSATRMIAERGADYVYSKPSDGGDCLYVHDRGTDQESAGCGVGWIVNDLFGEMVPRGLEGTSPSIHSSNYWLDRFCDDAITYLDEFQMLQDLGNVYSKCDESAHIKATSQVFQEDETHS